MAVWNYRIHEFDCLKFAIESRLDFLSTDILTAAINKNSLEELPCKQQVSR